MTRAAAVVMDLGAEAVQAVPPVAVALAQPRVVEVRAALRATGAPEARHVAAGEMERLTTASPAEHAAERLLTTAPGTRRAAQAQPPLREA